MTDETKTRDIALTRPRIGFCGLIVKGREIQGISYVNPWLLEDITDLFDDVADRAHSASMMLDCEGFGLAMMTIVETETIAVVRDDGLTIYEGIYDMPAAIKGLADSIKENLDDWIDWADHEGETPKDAIQRIADIIHRLYIAAERLEMGRPSSPQDALRLWAQVETSELTKTDAELLVAEMHTMCARTNALPKSPLQRQWRIASTDIRTNHDGSLSSLRIGMDSDYFEDRQLAFLRSDGTVEVAGWCDSTNMRPVMDAFARWCVAVRKLHAEVEARRQEESQ